MITSSIAGLEFADRASDPGGRPMVVTRIADVRPRRRRVAIGNFDGVHLGHAEVIRGCDTVLTFDPHPLAVLAPDRTPPLLTGLRDKIAHLGELGVAEVVVMPFDRRVARLGPDAFVEDVLVGRLGAVHVSVGSDFRFGARAAGDVSRLAACSRFTTRGSPLVRCRGAVVSSSRIRAAIAAGDVELAAELLGRPHRIACRPVEHPPPRSRTGELATVTVALDPTVLSPRPGSYRAHLRSPGTPAGARAVDVRVGCGVDSVIAELDAPLVVRLATLAGDDLLLEFLAPHR